MDSDNKLFEQEYPTSKAERYKLRLFVTGRTPRSLRAIQNLKSICEDHLQGRYELEVVDLFQHPELAKDDQIIAAPTLVKSLPLPIRKLVGDLSDVERVLAGLQVKPIPAH